MPLFAQDWAGSKKALTDITIWEQGSLPENGKGMLQVSLESLFNTHCSPSTNGKGMLQVQYCDESVGDYNLRYVGVAALKLQTWKLFFLRLFFCAVFLSFFSHSFLRRFFHRFYAPFVIVFSIVFGAVFSINFEMALNTCNNKAWLQKWSEFLTTFPRHTMTTSLMKSTISEM